MQLVKPLVAALTLLAFGASAVPSRLSSDDLELLNGLSQVQRRALVERLVELKQLEKRMTPTGTYAPGNVQCPAPGSQQNPGFIRNAANKQLNADEQDYIQRHRSSRQQDWTTWLTNSAKLDIPGGVQNYTSNLDNLPRMGFALSGGGLRAMTVGSGVLMGFDNRNDTANQRGTGGLLQLADYVAGLSGGSWATGSLAMNDWPTAQTLRDQVWNLDSNLVIPDDGKLGFYTDLLGDVKDKRDLDYGTSLTDYFGLAIADKVLNSTYKAKDAATWSDVKNTTNFQQAAYPFPIIMCDEREPGQIVVSRNTSIFEFTPYEFGSWNPHVSAFVPIEILGSSLDNGATVLPDNQCVEGFESFPWVVGTAATLFSGLLPMLLMGDSDGLVAKVVTDILQSVSSDGNDISTVPNPFYGFNENDSDVAGQRNLTLVDGGLDNQNLPLWTLSEPARHLDFIIAVDSSADVTNWPNGSAIYQTGQRAENPEFNAYAFPVIPDTNTFVNRGLNTRPVFFGCEANVNVTNSDSSFNGTKTPIVAYVPSYPYVAQVNVSTYELGYSDEVSQGILDNSVDVATLGGQDDTWSTCLACAALQRSFERSGVARPSACDTCMDKWCWDGVTDSAEPASPYSPATGTPEFVTSNGTQQRQPPSTGGDGSNSEPPTNGTSQSLAKDAAGVSHSANPVALGSAAVLVAIGAMLF